MAAAAKGMTEDEKRAQQEAEADSAHEKEAQRAESQAINNPKTVLQNAYRGTNG